MDTQIGAVRLVCDRYLFRTGLTHKQTLLTSLARATALLHMHQDLINSVQPIPAPPPKAGKGQKRIPRPKIEPDPAREEVEARCIEAMKLVRKVYVRHPNYGDLVRGLDQGGLECLEDRVRVSVGERIAFFILLELTFARYTPFAYAWLDYSLPQRSLHPSRQSPFHGRSQA